MLRSPRAFALRAGAVLVAVATAALVASDLATLHRRANDLGPLRSVVVARHDLPLGTAVSARDIHQRRLHTSQVPDGILTSAGDVIGRVVTTPVLRGGLVGHRNLAPRHRTGLDGAIPDGWRAMQVVVADAVVPRPGAAVDVLASFDDSTLDGTDTEAGSAIVVARGVLVVATGGARTAEGRAARGVTVLVTPREARDLAYASTHGVLALALVPPEEARLL